TTRTTSSLARSLRRELVVRSAHLLVAGSRRRQAGRRSDPSASSRFRPMKWRVHLAGDTGELRELAADAQTPELIIWQEGDGYVPESTRFEDAAAPDEVRAAALVGFLM